ANEKTGQRWVALFNLADEERELSARLEGDQALVELWTGETAHGENGTLRAAVVPHGCKVYQVC
ncbi:MAG: alpha-galactosidase, partial [Acutalibacter sp.]|nr:alpha-galactosidase [Acutalibacter sp.]